jgi:hypothetical protein
MLEFKVPTSEIEGLLQDPYLSKKYNRDVRLKDKMDYIQRVTPEVTNAGLSIVDVGPGPGEYLEWCRYFGNAILGVDSPYENAMGAEYEKLSRICHRWQEIPNSLGLPLPCGRGPSLRAGDVVFHPRAPEPVWLAGLVLRRGGGIGVHERFRPKRSCAGSRCT